MIAQLQLRNYMNRWSVTQCESLIKTQVQLSCHTALQEVMVICCPMLMRPVSM